MATSASVTSTKTALVTGANSGIGRALTLEFQHRGYKVYATDLAFSPETKAAFAEKNQSVICLEMDVTSNEAVTKVRDYVAEDNNGKLDFLYCNAGRVEVGLAVDLQDHQIESLYGLNLFGNMRVVREFTTLIVNTQGTIAFSGSVTKGMPLHSNSLYTSSKAALDQYAAVLQCEMRNYGVKVINVVGGYIKTDIFASGVAKVRPGSVFDFPEFNEQYEKRGERIADTTTDSMLPSTFAKRVLDKIEKADLNTVRVYEGTKASTLDLIQKVVPYKTLFDKMLNIFHLNFDYRKHLTEDASV